MEDRILLAEVNSLETRLAVKLMDITLMDPESDKADKVCQEASLEAHKKHMVNN